MTNVIVERRVSPPTDLNGVYAMAAEAGRCFDIYRVDWHGSMLTDQGARLVCHFESADGESARMALRQSGSYDFHMWPVTVHDSPDNADLPANVAVERSWPEPVEMADIQAMESAGAWCLDTYNVKFVRTFFSTDRKRMLCLYCAPDAESVRQCQRQINMPMDDVWAFERVHPQ